MKNFFAITGVLLLIGLLVVLWMVHLRNQEGIVVQNKNTFSEEERKKDDQGANEQKQCVVSGCSGELCVEDTVLEEGLASSCVWKEEYECYKEALCERQENGTCAWTKSEEIIQCLEDKQDSLLQEVLENNSRPDEEDIQEIIDTKEFPSNESDSFSSPVDVKELIVWGYTPTSNRSIDTIILHSSFNSLGGDEYDTDAIVNIYKEYGVGAHYIIDREGEIIQLIEDKNIAYHAGVSLLPDGRTQVNEVSIGIEIVANYDDGYTHKQYEAVNELLDFLKSRYSIKYILGHSEIAPDRKTDPWNFDWERIDR
jgi:hypothetical protein